MSKVIAICNQKGGVGKTTTAITIASYVAMASRRTLLIDLDPQANATSGLGINKSSINISTYECLLDHIALRDVVVSTEIENLYLAPSHIRLTGAEIELVDEPERENKLKWAVKLIKDDYDYIFIDTPPSLGLLTLNAFTAADSIIIPLQCEYYSLEGISQLLSTVNLIKDRLNPQLEIEGVLLTMADFRTRLTGEVIKEIKTYFEDKVYNIIIPRSVKIAESPGYGKPIFLYDPQSTVALKYKEIGEEFLRRNNDLEPRVREQSEEASLLEGAQEEAEEVVGSAGEVAEEAGEAIEEKEV